MTRSGESPGTILPLHSQPSRCYAASSSERVVATRDIGKKCRNCMSCPDAVAITIRHGATALTPVKFVPEQSDFCGRKHSRSPSTPVKSTGRLGTIFIPLRDSNMVAETFVGSQQLLKQHPHTRSQPAQPRLRQGATSPAYDADSGLLADNLSPCL